MSKWNETYQLVFVNIATRRAIATFAPSSQITAWVARQEDTLREMTFGSGCRVLTRDNDTNLGKAFHGAYKG